MENEIKGHGDHGNKVLNFTIDDKEYSWNSILSVRRDVIARLRQ